MVSSLSPEARIKLLRALSRLPAALFEEVRIAVGAPKELLPGEQTSPMEKSVALLNWSDSPSGCGLMSLKLTADDIVAYHRSHTQEVKYDRSSSRNSRPIIVLMESTLPNLVFDPETRKTGGTNADDITDILKDLPVSLIAESTSLQWHREQQVLDLNPDLVIVHHSCFYDEMASGDPHEKFVSFLSFMSDSRAKYIVYTRGFWQDENPEGLELWKQNLIQNSGLDPQRLFVFPLRGNFEQETLTFNNLINARKLKLLVKKILGLQ